MKLFGKVLGAGRYGTCEKCGATERTEKVVATNPGGETLVMILCSNCAEQVRALIKRLDGRS